jgi:hypothetical protein
VGRLLGESAQQRLADRAATDLVAEAARPMAALIVGPGVMATTAGWAVRAMPVAGVV